MKEKLAQAEKRNAVLEQQLKEGLAQSEKRNLKEALEQQLYEAREGLEKSKEELRKARQMLDTMRKHTSEFTTAIASIPGESVCDSCFVL